jgi:hypothetical protein
MSIHTNKILKKISVGLCSFYLSATIAKGAEEPKYFMPDDYVAAKAVFFHPQTVESIDTSIGAALVIGRGNIQGVVVDKITDPLLQGISNWFFLDPIPQHHNNPQTPDSIISKWPPTSDLEATFTGKFDRVLFDFGVLEYIGYTGELSKLIGRRYADIMNIKGDRTRESFEYPYQYENYIRATYPEQATPIHDKCHAALLIAEDTQRSVLKKGIQSAFSCLKSGGHLFIPLEDHLEGFDILNIAEILRIAPEQICAKSWSSSENLLLPEIQKGDGYSAITWKWFVISK